MPTCSCNDWRKNKMPCKHFCLLFIKEHLTWNDLSPSYAQSAYYNLDTAVVPVNQTSPTDNSGISTTSVAAVKVTSVLTPQSPPQRSSISRMKAECFDAAAEISSLLHNVPKDCAEADISELRDSLQGCVKTLKGLMVTEENLVVTNTQSQPSATPRYTPLKKTKSHRKRKSQHAANNKKAIKKLLIH